MTTADVDPRVFDDPLDPSDGGARLAQMSFWTCLLVVAVAGMIGVWFHRDWVATNDLAWQQLILQRIPEELPALGSYSRWDWSHPGPVFHYILWAPWRLVGGAPFGMLIAMLLLHLAAVTLAWLTSRSRSLALAVLVATGLLVVWAASGDGQALLPWNPAATMLLAGAFVVAAADASTRGVWGTALLLPIGSVLAQAHLGTALLVAGCVLAALASAMVSRGQQRTIPWKALFVSVLVALLLWAAPLAEAFPDGGNLLAIITTDTGAGLGFRQGVQTLTGAWAVPPYWWMGNGFLPGGFSIPFLAIIPAAAGIVAVLRRDAVGIRWWTVSAVGTLSLVPSIAVADQPYTYLVAWIPAVVMTMVAVSLWILIRAFPSGGSTVIRVAPVPLFLASGFLALHLVTDEPVSFQPSAIVSAVSTAAEREPAGVHVVIEDSEAFGVVPAVVSELARRGIPASGLLPFGTPAGLRGLIEPEQEQRRGLLIEFPQGPDPSVPKGWQLAAESDPFSPEEWRELQEFKEVIDDPEATAEDRAWAALNYEHLRAGRGAWRVLLADDPEGSLQ